MSPLKQAKQALPDVLWKASDKLRGSMDVGQYKEFILGLIFLRYLSVAFDERRDYAGVGVYTVPPLAHWAYLAERSQSPHNEVGRVLDHAVKAVMRINPSLEGVLPEVFNRGGVDQRRITELISLLNDARFIGHDGKASHNTLGEVYEYFLEKFARAEGKRGGEFYTPSSVAKMLVDILEPYRGRVYDPCCGSGGMLVQAEKFVSNHRGRLDDIEIYGQESSERTWRMAKMNLAIHGINGNLSTRWADTFYEDQHPGLEADYVMANPPFNMSDWYRETDDPRWRFGTPPARNANFAWMQHIISKLSTRGSAGIIMTNGSMSSKQSGEGEIRAAMIEADLVACVVALPPQLFVSTAIPACAWFLAKDKSSQEARHLADRRGEMLVIDARSLGVLVQRGVRVLTDDDLTKITGIYHAWRGTRASSGTGKPYDDEAGFCRSMRLEEIREQGYILTPGRYVGLPSGEEPAEDESIDKRIGRLTQEFISLLDDASQLERTIRDHLEKPIG
jgi:type I restriction enzyme M protein